MKLYFTFCYQIQMWHLPVTAIVDIYKAPVEENL